VPDPRAKILLVYPPSRTQRHCSCPMGLTMLASVLEKAGNEVHLLDANAADRRRTTAAIVEEAASLRPDIIGATLLTPLVKEAYRLAEKLRGCGAKLIAGGPHATLLPEEPLEHGFDAVVAGEGEPTIVEAVEALLGRLPLGSVQGLVYRTPGGSIEHNEPRPPVADLDTLPVPARHLVDPANFGSGGGGELHSNIFTSRGCVVDELVAVHHQYGTRHFHFMDDAMTMDKDRMRKICTRLVDERLGLTWSMMTRIDAVDEDLLEHASRGGCVQIEYGVESGSPDTLKRIHKPHTAEMVRRVIPLTHRFGIRPVVFFILGFPWEDAGAIDETLRLMHDIAPYVVFHPAIASILIPFPGTEIYDRYKDRYGFSDWWLGGKRTFDAPRVGSHAFYQRLSYRVGAVLDADFFRYTPAMKAKIHEVFRFMFRSNLRRRGRLSRATRLFAFDLSRKLDAVSPTLERAVFTGPTKLWQLVKGVSELSP